MTSARRLRALRGCYLAGLCAGLMVVAHVQPAAAQTAVQLSIRRVAGEEMERLLAWEDTDRSRRNLLLRNLSRYFALYAVPSNPDELARLLGTLERIALRVAETLYSESRDVALDEGSEIILSQHLEVVLQRLLPFESSQYSEVVFFPSARTLERVTVEEIDIAAFRDTGFGWQILGQLAESETVMSAPALPFHPNAVRQLGEGLAAYGLLILRVASHHAREEFAREIQSRHLREAAKSLSGRAATQSLSAPAPTPKPETYFSDVTTRSGVHFRHVTSEWLSQRRRYGPLAPTFSGGGVTADDLDGDQWPDLILCGGRGCATFRNRRDGTFEDNTGSTGLSVPGEARMAVVADLDNDGKKEVFITYARDTNRLFRGLGQGRFEDITVGSGLEDEGNISGPAIALDYDNDGDLDLYVGNFGNYLQRASPWNPGSLRTALPNRLYRNLGELRFQDVTDRAGVGNTGWTQAVSHLDFDLDGDQDIYVANDFGRNDLLVNLGDGTFASMGQATGSDDPFHGMNAAFADLNRDRFPDIFVTNIWTWNPVRKAVIETNTLLLSRVAPELGVSYEPLRDPAFLRHDTGWSWAALFLDYDNDGDDDLYVANGFTDYYTFTQYRPNPNNVEEIYPINNGRESNFLFRNESGLPTVRVHDSGLEVANENSRSVAVVDYDRDGDLDLSVSTFHSCAHLFRNDGTPLDHHWLRIELVGEPALGTARDAIGAHVTARNSSGLYVWRLRTGGEGYLGSSEPTLHFGLGDFKSVDLEVVWPGLNTQQIEAVEANQSIRIRQGVQGYELLGR